MEKKFEEIFDLYHTIAAALFGRSNKYWELLPQIADFIRELGPDLPKEIFEQRGDDIWIAKSAQVAPTACLNGPLIVDEGAVLRHCAFIRGSAIIGKNAVIGNSVEVKNSIIFDNAEVPHFNYVGDSILGYKAHLGAGAITSNIRNDKADVIIHIGGSVGDIETGLRKMGALVGDGAQIGCNAVLNPGTVICRNASVYPTVSVTGVVPEGAVVKSSHRRV